MDYKSFFIGVTTTLLTFAITFAIILYSSPQIHPLYHYQHGFMDGQIEAKKGVEVVVYNKNKKCWEWSRKMIGYPTLYYYCQ